MKIQTITKLTIFILTTIFVVSTTLITATAEVELIDGDLKVIYLDPVPITPLPNTANETGPVWYQENIKPGETFVRTVKVTNMGTNEKDLYIVPEEITTINDLSDVITISIVGDGVNFTKTLSELYTMQEEIIDNLAPNETHTYTLTALFDENAGNEYMNALTKFDYLVGFNDTPTEPTTPDDTLSKTGFQTALVSLLGLIFLILILLLAYYSREKKKYSTTSKHKKLVNSLNFKTK